MPRVKSADQIATLDRQKAELLAKLKENRAKAAAKKREELDRRALIAGRAVIAEIDENPASPDAAAILAVLKKRLVRRADRDAFGLPALLPKTANQNPQPSPAADATEAIEQGKPADNAAPVEADRAKPAEAAAGLLGVFARAIQPRTKT